MEHAQPPLGELRLRRLRWLCRRGMKELDVLLESFLARHAQALQDGHWPELESLLEYEDDQLWDFMLQPAKSRDTVYRHLVALISSESRHAVSAQD